MTNVEKIEAIVADIAKSKKRFCELTGIAQSTLSSWLQRDTIDYDKIAAAFPQINLDWLIRGIGPMVLGNEGGDPEYLAPMLVSEPTRPYIEKDCGNVKMVTIPSTLLDTLKQQLENKDAQIATLLTLLNK